MMMTMATTTRQPGSLCDLVCLGQVPCELCAGCSISSSMTGGRRHQPLCCGRHPAANV
jgi:hypothetical protein